MKIKSRFFRRLVWVVTFFLVLGILIHVSANIYLEILFKKHIHQLEEQSGGRYWIEYGNISLNLFSRSISLKGFHLIVNPLFLHESEKTGFGSGQLEFDIPVLKVRGIDWINFLLDRQLTVNKIVLRRARLINHQGPHRPEQERIRPVSNVRMEKPLVLPFQLKFLLIKKWVFVDCAFENIRYQSEGWKTSTIGFSFTLDQGYARFNEVDNRHSQLDLDSIEWFVREAKLRLPDNIFEIQFDELGFSAPLSKIWVNAVKITPVYSKYDFSLKKGYQSTWSSLLVNWIHFNRVSFRDLINRLQFRAERMSIRGFQLEFFRNRKIPPRHIFREYPFFQDSLKRVKLKFLIKTCNISKGFIQYQVQNNNDMKPGNIFFTDVAINSNEIGNEFSWLENNPDIHIKVTGKVMGKNGLEIRLSIPRQDDSGHFKFQGQMSRMEVADLNPILNPSLINAENGVIHRMIFFASANKYASRGVMKLYYNGLKVSVLSKKKEGKKAIIPSFFANRIILANNPRGRKPLRIGSMNVDRKIPRSIFNLIGRSFLSGIKSSIGLKKEKR